MINIFQKMIIFIHIHQNSTSILLTIYINYVKIHTIAALWPFVFGRFVMLEQDKLLNAKTTFQTICAALDMNNWKYRKDEEKLYLEYIVKGDDLPMDFRLIVDAERQIVRLLSLLPFTVEKSKCIDVAIAVSAINNLLVEGCFDFDISSGRLFFRTTNTFIDCKFGNDVILYMVYLSNQVVDRYNDKLLGISQGTLTIDKFLATISE